MEDRLPPQLMAVVDWPFYRLFGRCWAQSCGRRIVLHSPWALYICERTPIGVVITDKARALIAELDETQRIPAA